MQCTLTLCLQLMLNALVAMGFDRDQAHLALQAAQFRVEDAVSFLIQDPV